MVWKFLFPFILSFIPLQTAKNRRSQCISHFCFKGVGGTHCLMMRPLPVKDYLKWVFCLHKAISKIHHFFNNHKAYVYTKMKFSSFNNVYRRLGYCWSFDFPYQMYVNCFRLPICQITALHSGFLVPGNTQKILTEIWHQLWDKNDGENVCHWNCFQIPSAL